MKTPCYITLVCYPEEYIDWTYVETDEELQYITNVLLGDPAKGFEWNLYSKSPYYNSYVCDADELIIIKNTLEECIDEALQTTEEMSLRRYIDDLQSNQDFRNMSFDDYLKPFIESLKEVIESESFKTGTLKDYVDALS